MSAEVDQRVVEMRFDNAQFERGSRETMRTLDKLREKLQFKGAEEGFENLAKASRNVDFEEMSGALDTIQMKFNALDVIAMSVLNHITEKVISTGEQLVKSLSTDNIASGWDKYVEKTGNVQTIMNATGKAVEQVNGYLDKLMWYSDETSFSFAEMTSAMSQATAAGGDIGKMIPMIMGIANATADAGKSGFAFQSTIRNLIQSYSAGYLQLMDWKSLNLMGTGTKALKEELIATAEELGTIQKGEVTISNFENTLSKKWATREVMEKTFEKYAQMMTAAYELTQQNPGMSTSDALEQLAGKYGDVAERSAKAAQQAKSFSEVISSTKDAVSSKWMAVFETIFGGYDEAVNTWTEMANRLYDIFVPPIEELEDRLNDALDSGWTRFRKQLGDEADTYTYVLEKTAVSSGAISQEVIDKAGGIVNAMQAGLVNANLLQKGLEKAQKDAHAVLELSDEELSGYGKSREEVQGLADAFDTLNEKVASGELDLKKYSKDIQSMSGREHLIQSLWNLWDAIGKVITPIAEAFHEIFAPANSEQIYSFAEGLDRLTAKLIISDEAAEKIKMTFKGLFSVLKIGTSTVSFVLRTASKVFGTVLNALEPLKEVLLAVGAGFGEFAVSVKDAVTGSGSFGDKIESIRKSLGELLSPLGEIKTFLKNFSIQNVLNELFQKGSEYVDSWLNKLPDSAQAILRPVLAVLEQMALGSVTVMGAVGIGLKNLLSKISEFGTGMVKGIQKARPTLEEYQTTLVNLPEKVGEAVKTFSQTFNTEVSKIQTTTQDLFGPMKQFFTALKEGFDSISGTDVYRLLSLLDVALLSYTIGQLAKATKSFSTIVSNLFEGPVTQAFKAMKGSFDALSGALKSWTKNNNSKIMINIGVAMVLFASSAAIMSNLVDPDRFIEIASVLLMFGGLLTIAAKVLQPATIKVTDALEGFKARLLDSATLWGVAASLLAAAAAAKAILSGVTALMEVLQQKDMASNVAGLFMVVTTLYTCFLGLQQAMGAVVVGSKTIRPKTILAVGAAMLTLSISVKKITEAVAALASCDWEQVTVGTTAVIALMGSMYALAWAMKKFGGQLDFQNGLGFAGLAAGVATLAAAMKLVSSIPKEDFLRSGVAIGVFVAEMAVIGATAKMSLKTGAAFVALSVAVSSLVGSMVVIAAAMKLLPTENLIAGFGAVMVSLLALGGVVGILGNLQAANAATSMLTIAGAMLTLAGAVAVYAALGDDAWGGLAKCAVGLSELFLAVAALSLFKTDALTAAWTVSTLSGGLIKLAAACAVFNFVNWQALAAAGVALSGLIAILFGAGALASKFPLLIAGFSALGTAFSKFASGALKLTGAMAILGVLSFFAGPICQAIVNAAPDIEAALIAVIKMLSNVVIECAEPVGEALVVLAKVILQKSIDLIGWMWDGGDTGNGGIKGALDELGSNILEGIRNIFWPFENGFFQQRNIAVHFNPEYKAERIKLSDVFNFSGGKEDAEKTGTETGNAYVDGMQNALNNGQDKVRQAGADLANAANEGNREAAQINSPSKVFAENGMFLALGLIEGIQNGTADVKASMQAVAEGMQKVFCDFWGIHSPSILGASDTENVLLGMVSGMADEERRNELWQATYDAAANVRDATSQALDEAITVAQQKTQQLYNAMHMVINDPANPLYKLNLDTITKNIVDPQQNVIYPGPNGFTTKHNNETGNKLSFDGILKWVQDQASKYGLDISKINLTEFATKAMTGGTDANTLLELFQEELINATEDATSSAGTSGSSKTRTSTTKEKTAAEKLAEEYTKKLKSNKYEQDVADKEWSLWEAGDGQNADTDTYLEKKGEALDKALDLQEKRVSIAQEQYDKMQAEATATEDQKNEALSTLLDEQKTLTELQRERYENLYKEVLNRYSDAQTTSDDEYEHWTAFNEKTASIEAKSNRKIQNITEKIAIQGDILNIARKNYDALKNDLGEASVEAKAAYRDWLEAETEYQNLQNSLHEAQLEVYDKQIERYELEMKTVSNRQEMLTKLYQNGEYGAVARTIDLVGVFQNVGYQLDRVNAAAAKYDSYIQNGTQHTDEGIEALQKFQEERYSFVGYAETFADALDMSDDGKRMMMQFSNAVANNWTYLQNGFADAYKKIQAAFPEEAKNLSDLWGLFQRDGMAETITSAASTFVSVIEGDYGSALGSALNLALNLASTDFGKTLIQRIGTELKNVDWTKLFGIGGLIKELFGTTGSFPEVGAAFASIFGKGGVIASAIASLGLTMPELGLIAAAVAAVAFAGYELVTHWEDVKQWFAGFAEWWSNLFENLKKGVKGFVDWIGEKVSGFIETVTTIGSQIAEGLLKGITGAAESIWNGVKSIGEGIVSGFKKLFGIHSPSIVMAQMGGYLGQGLANGISQTEQAVGQSMRNVGSSAMAALTNLDESDYTPTISPVVDLSDTEKSANWAQSMFAMQNGNFGVETTRTAALASTVAQSAGIQNGTVVKSQTTSDGTNVVNAIEKLGDRVDKMAEKLSKIKLVMDSGKTVGELTPGFDSSMGKRSLLAERGVI